MRKVNRFPGRRLALSLLAVAIMLTGGITVAADVAKITSHGSTISWHPSGAYSAATLSISHPDGSVGSETFDDNEAITIIIPSEDGIYNYELVLTPVVPPGLRTRMEKHRANHPEGKFKGGVQGETQSGHFRVADGSVINDSPAE